MNCFLEKIPVFSYALYSYTSSYLHEKEKDFMQKKLTCCIKKAMLSCRKEGKAMHRFDYSFLHNGMLPAGLLNIRSSYSLFFISPADPRWYSQEPSKAGKGSLRLLC